MTNKVGTWVANNEAEYFLKFEPKLIEKFKQGQDKL